jgi:mono/diheme cytochrome c family protein
MVLVLALLAGAGGVVLGVRYFFPPAAEEEDKGRDRKDHSPRSFTAAQLEAAGRVHYTNHCLACHGDKGAGDGPAARFLYPRPRNFTSGEFRLVTTRNRIPSDDDLFRVITRGMPGSAMFPFAHLEAADRRALVAYVRHLTRSGLEERLKRDAAESGEKVSRARLRKALDRLALPGKALAVPAGLPSYSAASVARGHKLYVEQCSACHGKSGKGDGIQYDKDAEGMPIRPRDFTRSIFKGGSEREQLYARIKLGIPGAPMPEAAVTLSTRDIGDLINFIYSVADSSAQVPVENRRTRLVAQRVSRRISLDDSPTMWESVRPVRIVLTPLWWRNDATPHVEVAAIHDGTDLLLRLRWRDPTCNDRSVRPQDFEDMAAVQLFQGKPEPFLGMGAAGKPVDIWLWRAGWQADLVKRADVDTAYPNMAVDLYPFEKPGSGQRPHALDRQPFPFITARDVGNAQADPDLKSAAGSLRAKGFGTLTMRPRVSQAVRAHGRWKKGLWTVTLRRPLKGPAGDGLRLALQNPVAIAFAVWDGGAGDRNGQKLVSIWHDLELEP